MNNPKSNAAGNGRMNLAIQGGRVPGQFDFGLSVSQEERAARLHHESIVFDMLSMYAGGNIFAHFPSELQDEFRAKMATIERRSEKWVEAVFWPFEMCTIGRSDLAKQWMLGSGLTCGCYDIDIPVYDGGDPLSCPWEAKLERYTKLPWLRLVTSAADIRNAKSDGVIGIYANYQPVVPLVRDLKAIDVGYGKGIRSLMLTYNRMDNVGVGCTDRVDAGLSMVGVDVVRRCNELGIMVDTSHCGALTTLDACRQSKKPVNANHTAARSLYDHPRAKTDECLRAIADTGGVIGVLAVPYFLADKPGASVERMLDHIDYIAYRVGWQHVAIGTDWPLQLPDDVLRATLGSEEHRKDVGWSADNWRDVTARLVGFEDVRDLPNITRGLVKRGYSDEQVRGILGENALRVFQEVCG